MEHPTSPSPCAGCKLLRRKCLPDQCVLAPYFPADDPRKFAIVHKVFGASHVSKLLHDLPIRVREDAANSLAYEAEARVQDPVYGCVGVMLLLQHEILCLQHQILLYNSAIASLRGAMKPGPNQGLQYAPPSTQSRKYNTIQARTFSSLIFEN